MSHSLPKEFQEALTAVGEQTNAKHEGLLLEHARANLPFTKKTVRELPILAPEKRQSAIVISAGPSLRRKNTIQRILKSGYRGTLIAADAAYVACIREGLIPDFVVTLDPHPTRMVRWFGDPELEKNTAGDDYFERQDLDVEFRKSAAQTNQRSIELVDRFGSKTMALVSSSAPENIRRRLIAAKFDMYWWNPLIDDPRQPGSVTRALYELNGLPSFNTGGNVGTAAWVFATTRLKIPNVALTGMDMGYYSDTPLEMTQKYYELVRYHGSKDGIEKFFADFTFPLDGQRYYTDPTYFWYRKNLLQMLEKSPSRTVNCTEGGTVFSERLPCVSLDEFLAKKLSEARG